MDLRRLIAILRARLPLLLASTLLAAGLAFVYSSFQQKVYEATTTLIVGQSLSAVNPDYNQLLTSQRLSTTYALVATAPPRLEAVIERLGLDMTADELAGQVSADAPLDSTLLTITAQDADPTRAAAIANALADELIAASPAIRGQGAEFQKSVDAFLKATEAQIEQTQARVEDLSGLTNRTAEQDAALATLEGRLVSLRSTYVTLLSFSTNNASNQLTVISPATTPTSPVSPKVLLNTLLAAAVGLLLGAAIVVAIEYLDDTVKGADDAQEVTGLSTLGTITAMKHDRGKAEIYRVATLLHPRASVAEAYRTLRTNIEFAAVDGPIRTLLVTSSGPGEGKTVTAANLAVVFAQAGRRVLLVDADLRKPGIHLLFGLANAHGLTTLLRSDEMGVESVMQATEQANLQVVPTGPLPPNPAELLGSQRMRTALERLQAAGELVIFDSPPLQAVTDSAILSSFLDGTVLVIDASRSRRGAVRLGCDALEKAGAHVLGTVLNRVSTRAGSEYTKYYGEYHEPGDGAGERARGSGTSPGPSTT